MMDSVPVRPALLLKNCKNLPGLFCPYFFVVITYSLFLSDYPSG